jgi:hypothetical protein
MRARRAVTRGASSNTSYRKRIRFSRMRTWRGAPDHKDTAVGISTCSKSSASANGGHVVKHRCKQLTTARKKMALSPLSALSLLVLTAVARYPQLAALYGQRPPWPLGRSRSVGQLRGARSLVLDSPPSADCPSDIPPPTRRILPPSAPRYHQAPSVALHASEAMALSAVVARSVPLFRPWVA